MKLRAKKSLKYCGPVYDLTVDTSHSYNVEGLGVHNSAAGSLLCYMIGITDLDPIEHKLFFERFMDPDRSDMPDIDIDFEDPDAVKDLLRKEFGEDNVGCVSNYSTFKAKGLLKDLGRIYGFDHVEINKMNAQIDAEFESLRGPDGMPQEIKLDDALGASPTLRNFLNENVEMGTLFHKLYGRIRHVGRHAAGVIIGNDLPRETPTFTVNDKDTDSRIVQVSFTEGNSARNLSAMGLQKFDLLSLSTLKVISHALKLIAEKEGITYEEARERIRPHNLNLNDDKVLDHVFRNGNFIGIFQYEEEGIRRLTEKVKPDGFQDLTAIIAIYRPGTLASDIDEMFVRRKHGFEEVTYDHPILEDVLSSTYGCLIYQEQVMAVAHRLGKLTMGETNKLRKVLSKKKKDDPVLLQLRDKFISGCQDNGLSLDKAEKLYQQIVFMAGYNFNLSHAASYAAIGFQTAWLSTYYPLEFFAAVLTHGKRKELQEYVQEIRRQGYDVLPVDVNRSVAEHTIDGSSIRLALTSVDGVGNAATNKIMAGQPYVDLPDFIERSGATKTSAMPLVRVGAMRSLDPNVRRAEKRLELYYSNSAKHKTIKGKAAYMVGYEDLADTPDYPLNERVSIEYALLGFSIVGSLFEVLGRDRKIEKALRTLDKLAFQRYEDFISSEERLGLIPVMLKEVEIKSQKGGQMMGMLTFIDRHNQEFKVPCFAGLWKHLGSKVCSTHRVYLATFYRKDPVNDPKRIILGRGDYNPSPASAQEVLIDVDTIP
jgi:DNA polymerase III subunit alpha